MIVGMLWFDNALIPLADKIRKAADYYQKKYGRMPNLVLVHPSMMKDGQGQEIRSLTVDNITVRPYRPVPPGHIWIGIDESADVEALKAHNEVRS